MSGNIQQRVFDALAPHGKHTQLRDLYALLWMFERRSVYLALQRLVVLKIARRHRLDGRLTFALEAGAQRPEDRRGRPRKSAFAVGGALPVRGSNDPAPPVRAVHADDPIVASRSVARA